MSSSTDRTRASLLLVLVTLCWGLSFSLMKNWQDASADCPGGVPAASFTMIALRMFGAMLILAAIRPRLVTAPTWKAHRAGTLVGLAFFAGFLFQVIGLAHTTPARSAFVTSMSCAWVPPLARIFYGIRVSTLTLLGLVVGVVGAGVLAMGDAGESGGVNRGDVLTLIASVFFAFQVLWVDRLGRGVEPSHITMSFFATAGTGAALVLVAILVADGIGVDAWGMWVADMMEKPAMPLKFGTLLLVCTVVAFGLMNAYQPKVPASRAALIYLLESAFASIISVAIGYDQFTWPLVVGGGLILGGNLLVELPSLLRERRRTNLDPDTSVSSTNPSGSPT